MTIWTDVATLVDLGEVDMSTSVSMNTVGAAFRSQIRSQAALIPADGTNVSRWLIRWSYAEAVEPHLPGLIRSIPPLKRGA
jgi:hypothetical protein